MIVEQMQRNMGRNIIRQNAQGLKQAIGAAYVALSQGGWNMERQGAAVITSQSTFDQLAGRAARAILYSGKNQDNEGNFAPGHVKSDNYGRLLDHKLLQGSDSVIKTIKPLQGEPTDGRDDLIVIGGDGPYEGLQYSAQTDMVHLFAGNGSSIELDQLHPPFGWHLQNAANIMIGTRELLNGVATGESTVELHYHFDFDR